MVGYYEKLVSVRLAYTYRSHYFVGLDRSSSAEKKPATANSTPRSNFNVTKNVTLSVDALNITNSC